MPSLGELTVALGAVTGKFKQDLNEAKNELTGTARTMRTVVGAAGQLGVAVGAAGVAIITGLVKTGLKAIDTQVKTARSFNATANGLRTLQLVTEDYGVENAELASSMERLNQRLGQAQREGGPVADMLKSLGLNAAELARVDVDERVATIADSVQELGLSTSQTADLLKEFGIRSSSLVDVLRHGGDQIRSAKQDLKDFGLELSQVDARKVEAAGDAIARIGRLWEAVRNAFTVALAPVLTELADRFTAAAKSSGGFGSVTQRVVEAAITGFGKFLDVVHGLRVAFKAGELVVTGFGAVLASVVQLGVNAIGKLGELWVSEVNLIIAALNKIPGVDIEPAQMSEGFLNFVDTVNQAAEGARDRVGAIRTELQELAMQELPSDKFEKFLQAVRDRASEAADEAERVQSSLGGGAEGFAVDNSEEQEKEQAKLDTLRDQLADRLQIVAESLASEEELRNAQYARDLETLIAAEEAKLITEEEFMIARQLLEEKHQDELNAIREKGLTDLERFNAMSWKKQSATVIGELANLTSGVAQHSKTMFNINKAAGIANAVVNTAQGITKALSAYPPPISFAMAAAQAAAGLAQISAIKSASFNGGGGGSAPSIAGSTPAQPTTPVTSGAPGNDQQVVRIQGLDPGSLFSGRQVVDLLNTAVKDGARLVLE